MACLQLSFQRSHRFAAPRPIPQRHGTRCLHRSGRSLRRDGDGLPAPVRRGGVRGAGLAGCGLVQQLRGERSLTAHTPFTSDLPSLPPRYFLFPFQISPRRILLVKYFAQSLAPAAGAPLLRDTPGLPSPRGGPRGPAGSRRAGPGAPRVRSHLSHLHAAAGRLSGHFFRNANHALTVLRGATAAALPPHPPSCAAAAGPVAPREGSSLGRCSRGLPEVAMPEINVSATVICVFVPMWLMPL